MHKLFFLIRFLIWIGVITFFLYYPGEVHISWLGHSLYTSIFFLFIVLFVVDKVMAMMGKLGRYFSHDLKRDLVLSHYKSEVKSLKKANQKRLEKEQKEIEKQRQIQKEQTRQKWQARWIKVKNIFKRK